MRMNKCVVCGAKIKHTRKKGRPRIYCKVCSKYRPDSAYGGRYWVWWRWLMSCSLKEIRVLFTKRKNDMKYARSHDDYMTLKKEMVVLNEAYEYKKRLKL